jgi:hypothetical protein
MYNLREKLACCLLLIGVLANAQDPHFTQFNAAPFSVNPAYAHFSSIHLMWGYN